MKKSAFTLAEVLITLGIIGIVAALTIPILSKYSTDKMLDSKFEKGKNIISNGYKMMMSKDEIVKPEYMDIWGCQTTNCFSILHKSVFNIIADSKSGIVISKLPSSYAIQEKTAQSSFKWSDVDYIFMTGDGALYGLILPTDTQTYFYVVMDVNGNQRPNIINRDFYKVKVGQGGTVYDVTSEME